MPIHHQPKGISTFRYCDIHQRHRSLEVSVHCATVAIHQRYIGQDVRQPAAPAWTAGLQRRDGLMSSAVQLARRTIFAAIAPLHSMKRVVFFLVECRLLSCVALLCLCVRLRTCVVCRRDGAQVVLALAQGMLDVLVKEIKLLQRLDHPNIVRYLGYEIDPDNTTAFIFLELVAILFRRFPFV
jgi:hypothetical protein